MLRRFGKVMVTEHVHWTCSGTSPESRHPFSEKSHTMPQSCNEPAM